jgi:transcription antitermination factor NusG
MLTSLSPQLAPAACIPQAPPACLSSEQALRWFALYTMPQGEQSVRRMLDIRQIESFLPTYEVQKVWKNRQHVKTQRPLFPSYVFIRINNHQRSTVLSSPGALRIVGNSHTPLPIPDREIEFLRSESSKRNIEPYLDLVIGKKVRIRSGPMEGLEGTLVEKRNNLRFVLTVAMINQHAAIELSPAELELVRN